jgi:hypothetical protein
MVSGAIESVRLRAAPTQGRRFLGKGYDFN